MGSIGMFLAELFFMGIIFVGVGLLLRNILRQSAPSSTNAAVVSPRLSTFLPRFGKHQDDQKPRS